MEDLNKIFEEKGIDGVMQYMKEEVKKSDSMTALSKHVGISRQSMYNIFNSKNTPKWEFFVKMIEFFGYKVRIENVQ